MAPAKTVDFGFNLEKMPRLARTEVIADKKEQVERFAPLLEVKAQPVTARPGCCQSGGSSTTRSLRWLTCAWSGETNDRRANVDVDGRLLVPVPWGDAGYKGLGIARHREARILRRMLRAAQAGALWYYDVDGRCWLWNLEHRKATAISYLTNHPVTVGEYLSGYDAERTTWKRSKWGK